MNNRTNLLKKRADTLAEYIIERCEKLEAENDWMKREAATVQDELKGYGDAFFETISKIEGIEELGDGSIDLGFKDINGKNISMLISVGNPLHPIAKMLVEKNRIWRIKR